MLGKLIQARKSELSDGARSSSVQKSESKNFSSIDLEYNPTYQKVETLEPYRVTQAPKEVFYLPEYITEKDEKNLLGYIYSSENTEKWHVLPKSGRRLQKLGGDVSSEGLIPEPIPEYFDKIIRNLNKNGIFKEKMPNHILLNEYPPGVGIMPHTDGPLYYPFVVILSLESSCIFSFFKGYSDFKEGTASCSLFVEPRSLLIFSEDAYHSFLHSIGDNKTDSIALLYQVDKKTGAKDIRKCDIANIEGTRVWKNIVSDGVDSRELNLVEEDEKFAVFSYEAYFKREKRESMTIRFVTEKKI